MGFSSDYSKPKLSEHAQTRGKPEAKGSRFCGEKWACRIPVSPANDRNNNMLIIILAASMVRSLYCAGALPDLVSL